MFSRWENKFNRSENKSAGEGEKNCWSRWENKFSRREKNCSRSENTLSRWDLRHEDDCYWRYSPYYSVNNPNIKFNKIPYSRRRVVQYGRTERHTMLTGAFRNSANAPKEVNTFTTKMLPVPLVLASSRKTEEIECTRNSLWTHFLTCLFWHQ